MYVLQIIPSERFLGFNSIIIDLAALHFASFLYSGANVQNVKVNKLVSECRN